MSDSEGVSVILTCWNSRPYIDRCLLSLRQIGFAGETVIVDSGSSDGLHSIIPKGIVLLQDSDKGWSHAVNLGVRHASHRKLIISNPDIVFNPALYNLIGEADELLSQAGMVAPGLLWRNARIQLSSRVPKLIDLFCMKTLLGKYADALFGQPIRHLRECRVAESFVELPTASLFLTTKALMEKYPLDENLLGCEDWDLWRRLKQDGIRTLWVPSIAFVHDIGHSSKNRTRRAQRLRELNNVLVYADKWDLNPRLLRTMFEYDERIRRLASRFTM